jgi:hypothetical protein
MAISGSRFFTVTETPSQPRPICGISPAPAPSHPMPQTTCAPTRVYLQGVPTDRGVPTVGTAISQVRFVPEPFLAPIPHRPIISHLNVFPFAAVAGTRRADAGSFCVGVRHDV